MYLFAVVSVVLCALSGAPHAVIAVTNPYCNIASCSTKPGGMTNNTLCLYSNTTYGGWCAPNYKLTVSAADINTILTVSNNYRSKVALGNEKRGNPGPQPKATNMRKLSWDTELANMAQTYAQRCVYAHDTCRDVSRFQVGQNLFIDMSTAQTTTVNWTKAITSWYDEVTGITPAAFSSFPSPFSPTIGHYTQLVWGNTYLVGCGIASFKDSTYYQKTYPYKMLYVCNYGPSGNFLGQPVYAKGTTTGTACPSGTKLNATIGLCA